MPKELDRFSGVLAEVEKRKNICQECNGALHWVEIPLEGIGNFSMLNYLYCEQCDLYYICGEEEDENK